MSKIKDFLCEGLDDTSIAREIAKIAKMTARNDHSGSTLAGLELLNKLSGGKYKKTVEVIKHIQAIQKIYGSMPYELGQFRYTIMKQMWTDANTYMSTELAQTFSAP